jgi:probable rRNA maturation factor
MVQVFNQTKQRLPMSQSFFVDVAKKVLGGKYELSLVFVSAQKSLAMNRKFRNKNKSANVLSFPLEKNAGEIFINLQTKTEATRFEMSHKEFITFLLIHGCLHLKGFDHGTKMEKAEQNFLKKISF